MMKENDVFAGYGQTELAMLYGPQWRSLVENVTSLPVTDPRVMAFTLMCRRLVKQDAAYRCCGQVHSCPICLSEILCAAHESEEDLLALYAESLDEIQCCLQTMRVHRTELTTNNTHADQERVHWPNRVQNIFAEVHRMMTLLPIGAGTAIAVLLGLATRPVVIASVLFLAAARLLSTAGREERLLYHGQRV